MLRSMPAVHAQSTEETPGASFAAVASGDAIILVRHAIAPGTSDPAGFDIDDCSTQRNLSTQGRAQAQAIGSRIATALGTREIDVYSSAWCRCLDTGRLLGLREVRRLPALDSFFTSRENQAAQTETARGWILERLGADAGQDGRPPAVLVSHQVNITALTGVYPASGEMVIVGEAGGDLAVLSRIAPD